LIALLTSNIVITAAIVGPPTMMRQPRTRWITGTAIMSALVVVFDYTLKFSGVKIPFPMMPTMKFDLDGIPIVLALFLYGPFSALTTCFVAFVAILARSGAALSASMKALAEFGTVLGLLPFYKINPKGFRLFGIASGALSRILLMVMATLVTWPLIFQSEQAVLAFVPFLAIFNAIAAVVSISGGYIVYKAIARRAPALLPTKKM
jgi:riboflavin transporter FmnP